MFNRWLARLAMSFFVIAAVLAWEAYKAMETRVPQWRVLTDMVGAIASVALGIAGTRERHRGE